MNAGGSADGSVGGTVDALAGARAVADAVLYEGYLLYPYRASSAKNAVRWQFGVLGPPGARSEHGEPPAMHAELLVRAAAAGATVRVHLRFLQLQHRRVQQANSSSFEVTDELRVDGQRYLPWDEAAEHELTYGPVVLGDRCRTAVTVPGGEDVDELHDISGVLVGRVLRRRHPLRGELVVASTNLGGGLYRLSLDVANTAAAGPHRAEITAASFLGAHLLLEVDDARFLSLLDPPADAADAAVACAASCARCWPVLATPDDRVALVSPIILDDHPQLAPESAGDLHDGTEIDEILTLRVMTMTEEEKAEARATDPRAAAIIDRCDTMGPDTLAALHGRLRDPHLGELPAAGPAVPWADDELARWAGDGVPTFGAPTPAGDGKPWWDPGVDASVDPESDSVLVGGVRVARGARVTVHPSRRADAQDMFFAGREARVAAVFGDVDGGHHVAVTLVDDPAADLHIAAGRYLYFAPDELAPLEGDGKFAEPGRRSQT